MIDVYEKPRNSTDSLNFGNLISNSLQNPMIKNKAANNSKHPLSAILYEKGNVRIEVHINLTSPAARSIPKGRQFETAIRRQSNMAMYAKNVEADDTKRRRSYTDGSGLSMESQSMSI